MFVEIHLIQQQLEVEDQQDQHQIQEQVGQDQIQFLKLLLQLEVVEAVELTRVGQFIILLLHLVDQVVVVQEGMLLMHHY
jgi:ABC-type antimicrobial peptide transport system ATPase subunit